MAKAKTKYVCQECGYQTPKWMGRCPDCGAWNALVEEVVSEPVEKKSGRAVLQTAVSTKPEPLKTIDASKSERIDTGIGELNRVLGGRYCAGELVLLVVIRDWEIYHYHAVNEHHCWKRSIALCVR